MCDACHVFGGLRLHLRSNLSKVPILAKLFHMNGYRGPTTAKATFRMIRWRSAFIRPGTLFAAAAVLLASVAPGLAAPHLLVDMGSGKVISREQEFDRWYPASLTKLMTAYTRFPRGQNRAS